MFSPALLTGRSSEKQFIYVEFLSDYMDDPLSPASRLDFQLLSRFAEVYSVEYRIYANFTGLRCTKLNATYTRMFSRFAIPFF